MRERERTQRWSSAWLAAGLVLLVASLGCNLSELLLEQLIEPEVERAEIAPTATRRATATPLPTRPNTPGPSQPEQERATPILPVAPMDDEGAAANALEAQVIAVYEAIGPAVVNITNRSIAYNMWMEPVPQEGSGSGFVIDDQGHIVTNYHVIEGADELLVNMADGIEYEARLVGSDPTNDLAVIQIQAGENLPQPVVFSNSDALRVGQFVIAIGNPFGLEQTLTIGVISALGRIIQSPEDNRFIGEAIQTDAAINPGNSGGPLLDLQGRVIGVNSQIISPSRASAGIGFAVSSNTVLRVVPELIQRGYYPHPWLGATMLPLTPATARAFREAGMRIPDDKGLLVLETAPNGPAASAGIREGSRVVRFGQVNLPLDGDIIVAVDGVPVDDFEALTVYLETETLVGETVSVTVIRDGVEQTLPLVLGARPQ
jgi:S1-C subfamily serine protease